MSTVIVKVDFSEDLQRANTQLCTDDSLLSKFGHLVSKHGYAMLSMLWLIRQLEEVYGITIRHTLLAPELMAHVDKILRQIPFVFLQQTIVPPNTREINGFDFSNGTLSLTLEVE